MHLPFLSIDSQMFSVCSWTPEPCLKDGRSLQNPNKNSLAWMETPDFSRFSTTYLFMAHLPSNWHRSFCTQHYNIDILRYHIKWTKKASCIHTVFTFVQLPSIQQRLQHLYWIIPVSIWNTETRSAFLPLTKKKKKKCIFQAGIVVFDPFIYCIISVKAMLMLGIESHS